MYVSELFDSDHNVNVAYLWPKYVNVPGTLFKAHHSYGYLLIVYATKKHYYIPFYLILSTGYFFQNLKDGFSLTLDHTYLIVLQGYF